MARLVYKDNSGREKSIRITPESGDFIIGRNPNCQISTNNPSVSRNHGKIFCEKGHYVYEDLGSVNGTMLNDNPIKRATLRNNDTLKCGDFPVQFFDSDREMAEPDELPDRRAPHKAGADDAEARPKQSRPFRDTEYKPPSREMLDKMRRDYRETREKGSKSATEQALADRSINAARSEHEPRDIRESNVASVEDHVSYRKQEKPSYVPSGSENAEIKHLKSENELLKQEIARIRADKAREEGDAVNLNQMVERIKDEKQAVEDKIDSLKEIIEEKDRKLGELEIRNTRLTVEMDSITEKYLQLKEQVGHQKKLLEDSRSAHEDTEDKILDYEQKIRELENNVENVKLKGSESAELISSLKVKLTHKDRELEEVKRQLDEMEYELRELREENESIQASFNRDGGIQSELERKTNQLKEIIAEKENIIGQLRIDLEEKDKEIREVRMGVGFTSLEEEKKKILMDYYQVRRQLDEMKDKMRDQDYEKADFKAKIEQLENELAQTKEQAADISYHPEYKKKAREAEKLFSELKFLEETVEKMQRKSDEFSSELKREMEAEIALLKKKNESLLEKLGTATREIKAIDQAEVDRNLTKEKLMSSARNSDEILSQIKSDLLMLKSLIKDISSYLSTMKSVENVPLPAELRRKMEETDPDEIIGSLSDLVTIFINNTDTIEFEISEIKKNL
jgi:chromosome segregation ATPase